MAERLRTVSALVIVLGALAPVAPAGSGATGTIATIAGTGAADRSGDGGPAPAAGVHHPRGLAVMADGSFLVTEPFENVVRRVATDGTITTVAGDGRAAFGGDAGPATAAQLNFVHGVAAMPDGGFVLADTRNFRIRRVRPDGTIATVGGQFAQPRGLAAFPDGRILVADTDDDQVRLVRRDGTTVTLAGTTRRGFSGDGGPATAADLNQPFGVAPLPDGGFLVDDSGNNRVRRVWPNGTITTVAGDGVRGYAGDGGPAVRAELNGAHNVLAVDGGFLIADTGNHRIRLVRGDGTISTVAGDGTRGFGGDGGPAVAAHLDEPKAVAVTRAGAILIADASNNRVRIVDAGVRPVPPLVIRPARTSLRVRTGRSIVVVFRLNFGAAVTVRAMRGGVAVARASATARVGANRIVLRRRVRPGRYRLELAARRGDGATARASARLAVTP